MSQDIAIQVRGLSKRFQLGVERRDSLKERIVRGRGRPSKTFWALKDASFDVPRGSMFGIIGANGSGKSTALKVITGIYRPTSGTVKVRGRTSALLELGAGFHPELTGRENIILNGSILGMSSRLIRDSMDEIIDFAGLDDFIDSPIKVYSSGMQVRLGFAIAVNVDPEILIIDEVIAVGDEDFQRKCFDHMYRLRRSGATILLVSHSLGLLREQCDQAVWLDHGRVREVGAANGVVDSYIRFVNSTEAQGSLPEDDGSASAAVDLTLQGRRRGSGEIRFTGVELLDSQGEPAEFLLQGSPGGIRLRFTTAVPVAEAVFGLGLFNESGDNVTGPNSRRRGTQPVAVGTGYVDFLTPSVLVAPGTYRLDVAAVEGGHMLDYVMEMTSVTVRGRGLDEPGSFHLPGEWTRVTMADPEPVSDQR